VIQARRVHKAQLVQQAQLEPPGRQARKVLPVRPVIQEQQAHKVQQELG
jgi:hypothetical protein